ncbi:MAG: YibE/F family protein [Acidimicrobiales bacterium]
MAHAHHDHGGGSIDLTSQQTRRILGGIVVALAVLALIGLVVLRPSADPPDLAAELGFGAELVDATVTDVVDVACLGTPEEAGIRCLEVRFEVTSGSVAGELGQFQVSVNEATARFSDGQGIVVGHQPEAAEGFEYYFNDFQRQLPMVALAGLFVVAVIALGRWQGLRALVGVFLTGVVMVAFLFPAVLSGRDPVTVALVSAVVIALMTLYFTHGVNDMTTVALLGTFGALGLTAVLAILFTNLASFTGFSTEDAFYLQVVTAEVDIKGLILAGIIIGSLGVLDDVTVTQASAIWQLHEANPSYGPRQLYAAGVKIGRDHIASTVNTLVLAYAGAALPLLLLYTQAGRSLTDVAVGELVAVEIVRTLVGSIGLVAAVPLTTGLAAYVVTRGGSADPEPVDDPDAVPVAAGPTPAAATVQPSVPGSEGGDDPPEAAWEQFAPDDPEGW